MAGMERAHEVVVRHRENALGLLEYQRNAPDLDLGPETDLVVGVEAR